MKTNGTAKLLTPREVAEEFGISEDFQAKLRASRRIEFHKMSPGRSGKVYYQRSAWERFLEETRIEAN